MEGKNIECEAQKKQNKKLREKIVMKKDTIRTIRENNNGLFEQNKFLKEFVIELKNQKLRDFIKRIDMYDFSECEAGEPFKTALCAHACEALHGGLC